MVTLGVALVLHEVANALAAMDRRRRRPAGHGRSGRCWATSSSISIGRTAYAYSLTTLFVLFLLARRIVQSPFGLSLMAIRRNTLRASALGVPVNRRLIAVYTLAAAYAGAAGALLAQTTAFVSLEVLEFQRSADVLLALIIGGAGWLLRRHRRRRRSSRSCRTRYRRRSTPQFWMFWMGLFLVVLALVGRERLTGGLYGAARPGAPAMMHAPSKPAASSSASAAFVATKRRHLPAGTRRAPGADRPQRRGQDHLRQPADRRAARPRPAR